jgi:signal transduction histidine kinase
MLKYLWLFFFLSYSFSSFSQKIVISARPANFEKVMVYKTPTVAEIDTILNLCYRYIFMNEDTCLLLAERAVELSERFYHGDTIHAKALLFLGDAYRSRSEWEPSEKALLAGRDVYWKLGLESGAANAELKLGAVNTRQEKYEKALDYHFSALTTWERLKDSSNIFKPWFEIAEVFHLLKQPRKALEYNGKALAWGEANDAPNMTVFALNNQGTIQQEFADEFELQAVDTTATAALTLQDSAMHYRHLALASYNRALPRYRLKSPRILIGLLMNIIDLKAELGQYDEALELAEEAAVLAERLNSNEFRTANTVNLSKIYRLTGQPEKSVREAQKGLENPAVEKNALILNSLYEELYLANKAIGQYDQALLYHELITDFRLKNEASKRIKIVSAVEARYQTARKEKHILELNVANAAIKQKSNLYMLSAALLTLFGFIAFQFTRVRRERNQKAAFTEALIDAQEDERKRIARDLHDGIGQSLLVIKQQLDINQNATTENRRLIASTLEEVRTISRDLHPILLEKFGITTTLRDTVKRIDSLAPDIFVSSDITEIDGLISPKAEVQIYRTVQEALSNVIKHAGASAAKVTVEHKAKFVEVFIQDNGKGFDYELVVSRSRSLGLQTMFERITLAGGKFTIKSTPGSGTEIRVKVPVSQEYKPKNLA